MNVKAQFSRLLKREDEAVELAEGATVADLLAALGFSELHQRSLRASRRDEVLKTSAELFDDDEILVFTMLGGG